MNRDDRLLMDSIRNIQATNDEDLDGEDDSDDDKMISEDGYTFMTPEFDERNMEEALENPSLTEPQAKLPPQEAYETMKFQAPLSQEEMDILDEIPGLEPEGGLSFIDDADHNEWLMQRMRERHAAMDDILEDQMYGEFVDGLTDEERMDRAGTDSDSGFSIRRGLKRVGRGVKKVGKVALTPANIAKAAGKWSAAKAAGLAKAVASKAAYPIKRASKPAIVATARAIAKRKGHAKPDRSDYKEANKRVIATFSAQRNPMVKFAGKVMKYVGTGVSGLSGEEAVSIVGFTGMEIAALATASAVAVTAMNRILIPMLTGKASEGGPPQQAQAPAEGSPEAQPGTEMSPDGSLPPPEVEQEAAQAEPAPPETESTESGKYYRSIKDPMADMDGDTSEFVAGMTAEERMDRAGSESEYDFSLGDEFVQGEDEFVQGEETFVEGEETFVEGDSFIEGRGKGRRPMTPHREAKLRALRHRLMVEIRAQAKTGTVSAKLVHRFAKISSKIKQGTTHGYWVKKIKKELAAKNVKVSGDEFVEGSFVGGEFIEGGFMGDAHLQIIGEDSTLGDFATDVLGLNPSAIQKNVREMLLKNAKGAIKKQASTGKVDGRLILQWSKLAHQSNLPKKPRNYWANQMRRYLASKNVKVVAVSGNSDSGQWLYKLDPRYWVKSSREKKFVDAEKRQWQENYEAQKRMKDQGKELEAGRRAVAATAAARQTAAQAAAIDTELKDIEQSVSGAFVSGAFVGDEKNKQLIARAFAAKEGQREARKIQLTCQALSAKLSSGKSLSPRELKFLRRNIKSCQNLKRLSNALAGKSNTSGYREDKGAKGDFLGSLDETTEIVGNADITEIVGNADITEILGDNPTEILGAGPSKLSLTEKKQLAVIVRLARKGVPQAQYALAQLKKKGVVSGVGGMGSILSSAFKIATAPIWLPAKYGYKGAKYLGQKAGIVSKPRSAAQIRASRIKAARAKRLAALKRREAAMARTQEARQKAAMEAQAADQEAAAAQAAAEAEQAAAAAESETEQAEAQAEEAPYTEDDQPSDESGMGAFVGAFVGAIANPKHKKIVEAAATNTPMGKKIRAGAAIYKAAKAGNPKARLAVAKVAHKAKSGDLQAKRDYNAIKAGKIAITAKGKAQKTIARKVASDSKAKGRVALRSKLEQGVANKLIRVSRKRQLTQLARVEKKAAGGDKKSRAIIAACVARASKGDKKAQAHVKALKLVKNVRVAGKTPAERRRLMAAQKQIRLARKGNKKAIQNIKVVQAAAKAGQPNAKRAEARLKIAAAVEKTVSTGKVNKLPGKSNPVAAKAAQTAKLAEVKRKVAAGAATKEEALAGAKAAQKLGLKEEAAELAMQARTLRSATETMKNSATVAAAAQGGNQEAKELVKKTLESAEVGNPAGLNSAGNLAAVQAVDAVNKGLPMPPQVAEATQLIERSKAGDPEAKRIIQRVTSQSQEGPGFNPAAVAPAIALVAAGGALAAMAAKPTAQAEWKAAAAEARGQRIESGEHAAVQAEFAELYAKTQRGEATRGEANRARELAMALGKPKLAAQISAIMPPVDLENPLTSMPDAPLKPIRSTSGLIKASLKALFLATRDPIQNYREGVQSRGGTPMAVVTPAPRVGKKSKKA